MALKVYSEVGGGGSIQNDGAPVLQFDADNTFKGVSKALIEKAALNAVAPSGVIDINIADSSLAVYTVNASANFTPNFKWDALTALDAKLAVGQAISVVVLVQNGATPYYPTATQIDGSAVTVKWVDGLAVTAGDANSINSYSYTIIKTASGVYTVLGSQAKFA